MIETRDVAVKIVRTDCWAPKQAYADRRSLGTAANYAMAKFDKNGTAAFAREGLCSPAMVRTY